MKSIGLTIIVFLGSWLLMSTTFKCSTHCNRTFTVPRYLAQHRTSCPSYQHQLRSHTKKSSTQPVANGEPPRKRLRLDPDCHASTNPSHGGEVSVIRCCGQVMSDSQAQYMETTEATSAGTSMRIACPSLGDTPSLDLVNAVGLGSPASSPIIGPDPPNEILPPRARRLPARFRDILPTPPVPVPPIAAEQPSIIRRVILHVFDSFRTHFNLFGIAREYRHRPSHDPDAFLSAKDLSNFTRSVLEQVTHDPAVRQECPSSLRDNHAPPWPWANMSIWRLMNWRLTGSAQKSSAEVNRLVREVIQAEDFNILELDGFNAHTETSRLDAAERALPEDDPFGTDQWKTINVEISIPTRKENPEGNGRAFYVEGLRYRPLTSVIRAVFAEASSKLFHLTPFKRMWRSPLTGEEQCVYDELYTSDAWIQAHDEIMKQRREDNCQLERVIAGMMFWSDATRLAQFGHASAWPIYLFFGNLSKYLRAKRWTLSSNCFYSSGKPILHVYSHVTDILRNVASRINTRLHLELFNKEAQR